MGDKVEVFFGNSHERHGAIVVKEIWRVGEYKDDEGNPFGPEYNALAESWMARTDMSYIILTVSKSALDSLTASYTEYIHASREGPYDEEKTVRLKEAFLLLANA